MTSVMPQSQIFDGMTSLPHAVALALWEWGMSCRATSTLTVLSSLVGGNELNTHPQLRIIPKKNLDPTALGSKCSGTGSLGPTFRQRSKGETPMEQSRL